MKKAEKLIRWNIIELQTLMAYSRIEKRVLTIEDRWYIHREIGNRIRDDYPRIKRRKWENRRYEEIGEKLIQLDKLSVDWIKPNEKI